MSIAGISSAISGFESQNILKSMQQVQQEFQQLGQDLQSGNMSAAQKDYVTLQQDLPQDDPTTSAQNSNPIAQAFNQLSQDLQSGNLSAAQQDYSTIKQDIQGQAAQQSQVPQGSESVHGHHHHHGGGGGGASEISQELSQLGQDLQSGNLASAQQAYNSLQQNIQQFVSSNGQKTEASAPATTSNLSVNA